MQAILAKIPKEVRDYKDPNGFTIVDYEFDPFANMVIVDDVNDMKPGYFLRIRHDYSYDEIERALGVGKIVRKVVKNNIQDVIDLKIEKVVDSAHISATPSNNLKYDNPNYYQEDIEKMLKYGNIKCYSNRGTGEQPYVTTKEYHVDFVRSAFNIKDKFSVSSYYSNHIETPKTVVLRIAGNMLPTLVQNDLITLGQHQSYAQYSSNHIFRIHPNPAGITSKYIHHSCFHNLPQVRNVIDDTKYTNYRLYTLIQNMQLDIDELKKQNMYLEERLKRKEIFVDTEERDSLPYLHEIHTGIRLNRVWTEPKPIQFIKEYVMQTSRIV